MTTIFKFAYIKIILCLFLLHVAALEAIGTFFFSSQILFIILYIIFHLFYLIDTNYFMVYTW
jgi:hypothetical protein